VSLGWTGGEPRELTNEGMSHDQVAEKTVDEAEKLLSEEYPDHTVERWTVKEVMPLLERGR
jgi:hypothetical protein